LAQEGKDVEYHDVVSDSGKLEIMLKHSNGKREVPVIVDAGEVSIGFDGGS
jgi:glutaredoxin